MESYGEGAVEKRSFSEALMALMKMKQEFGRLVGLNHAKDTAIEGLIKQTDEYKKIFEESRLSLEQSGTVIEKQKSIIQNLTNYNEELNSKEKNLRVLMRNKLQDLDEKRKVEEDIFKTKRQELEDEIKKKDKRITLLEKEKALIQQRCDSNLEKLKNKCSSDVQKAELKALEDKERIGNKLRETKAYFDKEIGQKTEKLKKLEDENKELKKKLKASEQQMKIAKSNAKPTRERKSSNKRGKKLNDSGCEFYEDYLNMVANEALETQKRRKKLKQTNNVGEESDVASDRDGDPFDSELDDVVMSTPLNVSVEGPSTKRVRLNRLADINDFEIED